MPLWAGKRSPYSGWLRVGRSGDRIPVGARFSTPVQTGPGAHPASCRMGTGSFPGVKSGRGVTLNSQPLLVPWSWKGRAIPLLPLWAVWPVQNLSDCTRVHFTFYTSYSTHNVFRGVSDVFEINFGSSNEGGTHVHKFYKTEKRYSIPFHQLDNYSCFQCTCIVLLSVDKQTLRLGFAIYRITNGFKGSWVSIQWGDM